MPLICHAHIWALSESLGFTRVAKTDDPGSTRGSYRLRKTRYTNAPRAITPVMMRMMISVVRWRGVVVMLGSVSRMRSAASPTIGILGLLGGWGSTVGVRSLASLVST